MKKFVFFAPFFNTIKPYASISQSLDPNVVFIPHPHKMTLDDEFEVMDRLDPVSIFGLLTFTIILGATAQSFINSMIQGEQGLGAFLSDGEGFKNSKFKPLSRKPVKDDPLPWLKLPKLSFVEVAGQEEEEPERFQLIQELMQRMDSELQKGDTEGATQTKYYIDSLLNESDIN